jgi:diguanylate cyclase (GGDEF)-like protein
MSGGDTPNHDGTAQQALFSALLRIFLWSTVLALVTSGTLFAGGAFITLREQFENNISLVARTASYSTEAAVMFGDRADATEILAAIVERERLCRAVIRTENGAEFVSVRRQCDDMFDYMGLGWLMDAATTARADIVNGKQKLGVVELRGDSTVFSGFIHQVLLIMVVSVVAAALAANALARQMERRLVAELAALATVARASRLEGNFTRRLPRLRITEFDELAQDFNALFSEIQARNTELTLRQSQLEIVNGTLAKMAMHDSLTGLANRTCFDEQLEKAIGIARSTATRVGILYIDNDHFKAVNDNFGHDTGDALLVDVARRLRGSVRESDLVARLGGDEFAILLAPLCDEKDAMLIADKILATMARKLRLTDRIDIELAVSIGMAIFPDHADNAASLLRAADQAMYRAKRRESGNVCMHDPGAAAECSLQKCQS